MRRKGRRIFQDQPAADGHIENDRGPRIDRTALRLADDHRQNRRTAVQRCHLGRTKRAGMKPDAAHAAAAIFRTVVLEEPKFSARDDGVSRPVGERKPQRTIAVDFHLPGGVPTAL